MTGRGHAACISGLAFSASTIVLGVKTRFLPLVVIESLDASSKHNAQGWLRLQDGFCARTKQLPYRTSACGMTRSSRPASFRSVKLCHQVAAAQDAMACKRSSIKGGGVHRCSPRDSIDRTVWCHEVSRLIGRCRDGQHGLAVLACCPDCGGVARHERGSWPVWFGVFPRRCVVFRQVFKAIQDPSSVC